MVRLPVAGRIKTRLARKAGIAEAARFYRTASRAVIARLSRQPFWETILAVAPDTARDGRVWPRYLRRLPQGAGDIGRRMQRPMHTLPPGPVCVVGTDVPGIEPAFVRRAFRLLGNNRFVFGPAADGGFWLAGASRRPRLIEPYADVRWSSSDTLADVRRNLSAHPVGITNYLHDVDEIEDLAREQGASGRLIRPLAIRTR